MSTSDRLDKLPIVLITLLVAGLFIGAIVTIASEEQGRVFVLREYMCESERGPAKVIEYFVDGLPSVAVFYDGDAEQLEKFREYLRRVGR